MAVVSKFHLDVHLLLLSTYFATWPGEADSTEASGEGEPESTDAVGVQAARTTAATPASIVNLARIVILRAVLWGGLTWMLGGRAPITQAIFGYLTCR